MLEGLQDIIIDTQKAIASFEQRRSAK